MTVSTNGLNFLKQTEALRLTAYNLGDGWTIGYGNKFYEDGTAVKQYQTITAARAEQLFKNIANKFASEISKLITSRLTQNQFDAVLSYAYNRGTGKFKASELLKMINRDPNNKAIKEQFVIEWGTNQTYKSSIITRRIKEAELYFSGSGTAQIDLISIIFIVAIFYIIKKYFL